MDEGCVEDGVGCFDRLGDVDCHFVRDEYCHAGVGSDGSDVVTFGDTRGDGYAWDDEICHGCVGLCEWLEVWGVGYGVPARLRDTGWFWLT